LVKRNARASGVVVFASAVLTFGSWFGSAFARADTAPVAVTSFEQRADAALTLAAAAAEVDQRSDLLQLARDKAGPALLEGNDLGPHQEVVYDGLIRRYVRFAQTLGVSLPILGKQELQQQDVASAATDKELAQLDYRGTKLQLIANVRESYIDYWAATHDEEITAQYLQELAADKQSVTSFYKTGFWTQANVLRYQAYISSARADLGQWSLAQKTALGQLGLATNASVEPFPPLEPGFATCDVSGPAALALAVGSDVPLAELLAQEQLEVSLVRLQRYLGYDGTFDVGANGSLESPGGLGYGLQIGTTIALPLHVGRMGRDQVRALEAKAQQYDLLAKQRRAELGVDVQQYINQRDQSLVQLAASRGVAAALDEEVKEARVRLRYIAPATLAEVQADAQDAYKARLAIVENQAAALLHINDLLQLAPDACPDAQK
jgi:outer membrane protein TolC